MSQNSQAPNVLRFLLVKPSLEAGLSKESSPESQSANGRTSDSVKSKFFETRVSSVSPSNTTPGASHPTWREMSNTTDRQNQAALSNTSNTKTSSDSDIEAASCLYPRIDSGWKSLPSPFERLSNLRDPFWRGKSKAKNSHLSNENKTQKHAP